MVEIVIAVAEAVVPVLLHVAADLLSGALLELVQVLFA